MSDAQQFRTLYDAPNGSEFASYAKDIDLFETDHFSTLSEWLDDRGYPLDSEIAYLATFAYIAGGWTRDTPETLIDTHGMESMADASDAAHSGELDDFSDYNTRHSHRKVNASRVKESFQSLESLTVAGQPVSSFEQFFEVLNQYQSELSEQEGGEKAAHETFVTAWSSLKSISYFGPLTGYDWLEVIAFVHGHEELTPPAIRPRYLKTGGNPPKGFEEVFSIGVDDDGAERCVQLLEEFARDGLDKEMPSAMFDMESALCVFYKDIKNIEMDDGDAFDSDCFPNREDDCY